MGYSSGKAVEIKDGNSGNRVTVADLGGGVYGATIRWIGIPYVAPVPNPVYEIQVPATTVTSDTYVLIQEFGDRSAGVKTVLVKNTHATNSLDYKITGMLTVPLGGEATLAEGTLVAGAEVLNTYTHSLHKIKIYAKRTISPNDSTIEAWSSGRST